MSLIKKSKSVDSITAKLNSTVAELESHAQAQLARAAVERAKAAAAKLAHEAHTAEHDRAKLVASNIKALLGG